MLTSRTQIGMVAGLLIACGLGLTLYKSITLGLPLLPRQYQDVWTIESVISFEPGEGEVEVLLSLPADDNGWITLNENYSTSGFDFTVLNHDAGRHAHWTRSSVEGPTTLHYKAQVYQINDYVLPDMPPQLTPLAQDTERPESAMLQYVGELREKSSGAAEFTSLLLQAFFSRESSQQARFILSESDESRLDVVIDLLTLADIPAHRIRGVQLHDGRKRQTLRSLIEVHDGDQWVPFDPYTALSEVPADFYVWSRGDQPILSVVGGRNSSQKFALVKNRIPLRTVVSMEEKSEQFALLDFSIYALPVEQQGIFRGLLLIPVAALVVVFMRIVVGISTSGTFMPILIALAFIQTTLLVGLPIFLLVISIGLWMRSYLSHLNLLLVSRVAAVVIVVILIMASIAVTSAKLGMDQALTVTFFPTIILAWTIERMSILWEEEGGHEVFVQGGGSLLVAILAYLTMSNSVVEHLTFNFPELLFAILGLILLLGKYTGYRLSELYRFRHMKRLS